MSVKISIIGAGSAVFSLNMIKDICLTPNLQGSTVSFMDINPERLESAYKLCQKYAKEVGIQLNLEKTTDRRESLKGADFVINTALAASHDRLREGWKIAMKHGYRFGGSLNIVHDEAFWINFYQLRLMEDILKDIREICPNAWYILVANPVMAGVTYLKRKYPDSNIVGLCHGYAAVHWLAKVIGLDESKISFELPGVNHFLWLTKFYYDGQIGFRYIDKWIEEKAQDFWKKCGTSSGEGPKAVDLYKWFGAFPIGDTCVPGGGSWGYWYHTDDETEKRWQEDPMKWYEGYFTGGLAQVEKIKKAAEDPNVKVTDVFPGQHSREQMIPLIESLACGVERILILNIMNDGEYVPGVPRDFQVEVPCLVSKKGIQGIKTDGLPRPLLAFMLRDKIAPAEIELAAFEKGDRRLLLSLILTDPRTNSLEQAEAFLNELLSLPYHEEMRSHYK